MAESSEYLRHSIGRGMSSLEPTRTRKCNVITGCLVNIPRVTVSPTPANNELRPTKLPQLQPFSLQLQTRFESSLSPRSLSHRDGSSGSGSGQARPSPVGQGGLRRESYLYRSDSDYEFSSLSRHSSFNANDSSAEEPIVTPFAQILQSLRRIWANYIILNNIPPTKSKRACFKEKDFNGVFSQLSNSLNDDQRHQMSAETLEDLEWCLEQLETTHIDRSVSDLATSKFRRMLSRELSHFAETKGGNEISEYICHTFLDKQQDVELPVLCVENVDDEINDITISVDQLSPGATVLFPHDDVNSGGISPSSSSSRRSTDSPSPLNPRPTLVRSISSISSPSHRRQVRPHNGGVTSSVGVTSSAGVELASGLPKYGVQSKDDDVLTSVMTNINKWGIDVFRINELTNGRPLTAIAYTILQERELLSSLRIPPVTMLNYLTQVEANYDSHIPYHNSIHASDVTQTAHVMLRAPVLENVFTDLEILAVIFATSVHDVDHPGVNNQFLIDSGSELALIYNDESVLENHHLAVAFKLLQCDGCDILSEFTRKQRQLFRRIVIDMVLATDMSKHMDHLAHLKTMVETRRISGNCEINMENYNERIQVLQNLIHCADLSNPAKPLGIYSQWIERITNEFHLQGDLERQLGMELSPMCDRNTTSIDKSQVGFIDYIVNPLWETWSELVFPDFQYVLDAIELNRAWCITQGNDVDQEETTLDAAPNVNGFDRLDTNV